MSGLLTVKVRVLALLLLVALLCTGAAHAQDRAPSLAPAMTDVLVQPAVPPPPPEDELPYNSATVSGSSFPATMVANALYDVSVTMHNNGTTAWSPTGNYALGSASPSDNTTWGVTRAPVLPTIIPRHSYTFSFQVRAPATLGLYPFSWRMLEEGYEWFGETMTGTVTVNPPAPVNNAVFVNQSVPPMMVSGVQYPVSMTFTNNGNTIWNPIGARYGIAAVGPVNNSNWGPNRATLPGSVAPGAQVTVSWAVTAPTTPGPYNFQWMVIQEGVELFGTPSQPVAVTVDPAPANGARAISMAVSTLNQGQAGTVSVTMLNTGSTTWAASNYMLGSQNPGENATWGVQRVALAQNVAPGQQYTFTFAIAGPAPGNYNMQWQMMERYVAWFGDIATRPVLVSAPGDTVTYIHTDGLGSPVARTDAGANLLSRTQYEPYGLTTSGATPTTGFTGHMNDADTGLVYMQQRYYDPLAGRFLSIDPVTTDANTGGSFNRYAYAANNPYKYVDPDGRQERAAEAFSDQFRNDAASGNSGVYEPFHTPVVIATIGMVVGPPIAAAMIAGAPAEAAIAGGVGAKAAAQVAKVAAPTEAQAKNIQRFTSKLPANAKDSVTVKPLPNGGVAAQGVSPGKVPGSSALYEKQIDSAGKTIQHTKTTTAPDGAIVHVKDKITGNVVTP